jgi:glycine/D-amino acid oxidase-like deaminating enzyme
MSTRALKSIVIVGGGIFGITAAIELAARGWEVTVLDQGSVPHPDAASTDISKVIRMDYGADEIYTAMGEASIEGWLRWNAEWSTPLFHQDGFLVMTHDAEMQPGSFERESFEYLTQRGHGLQRVKTADLRKAHPAWNAAAYRDGYLNPTGGWAESGQVVTSLAALAELRGVTIYGGSRFASFIEKGARVTGVRDAAGREWNADLVLVAAGAWTPFLLPDLRTVMKTTGQPVVHFQPANADEFRPPAFPVWAADIGRTGWYGFPANADGIVKVANHGPGREILEPNLPREVTRSEVDRFRCFLSETFPTLASAPMVLTRQCWYCDTFDGHFWIDCDSQRPGLLVAAGDSGHAFKFAPVLGGLIADVVESKANAWAHRFRARTKPVAGADGARAKV